VNGVSPRARDTAQIRVLFDGACPLCSREIRMLERLDRGRGRIAFEDISQTAFDPAAYRLDMAQLMARIHGVLPDGSVVEGLEVFRRAYAAVGLGWLLAPTRWPLVRDVAEAGYRIFARNRLRWTGREAECTSDRCRIPEHAPHGHRAVEGETGLREPAERGDPLHAFPLRPFPLRDVPDRDTHDGSESSAPLRSTGARR